jgi:SAM-dependent MidA family methyltransferase
MPTSSNNLITILRQEMEANNGSISFDRFMALALYHPQYGYYCREPFTIGELGDFTTAPEISPLFGACVAQACQESFPFLPSRHLLELGAGSGRLAVDVLTTLAHNQALPDHYFIYEISPLLRQKQQSLLQEHCAFFYENITWLTELPEQFEGILIANEVLDALPVARFRIENNQGLECQVSLKNDQLIWKFTTPSPAIQAQVEALLQKYALPATYESEISLALPTFIEKLAGLLKTGIMLLIDYGYSEAEYYHPERNSGTLTCFYHHHKDEDPLSQPGEKDITAHVNFTQLAELAVEYGCEVSGYTTQAAFLLEHGLLTLAAQAEENMNENQIFKMNQAIKTLTFPTEMGEVVKVMRLSKNLYHSLPGFAFNDRRRDL